MGEEERGRCCFGAGWIFIVFNYLLSMYICM